MLFQKENYEEKSDCPARYYPLSANNVFVLFHFFLLFTIF